VVVSARDDVKVGLDPAPGSAPVECRISQGLVPYEAALALMEARANAQVIRANVPLGQMFGYATDVRSMTQGRATYTMQFARYEEVPRNLAEEIMAKSRGEGGSARGGSR